MPAIASCPRCARSVAVPDHAGDEAEVRCPLCQAEYKLAETVASEVPELVLIGGSLSTMHVDADSHAGFEEGGDELAMTDEQAASVPAETSAEASGKMPDDGEPDHIIAMHSPSDAPPLGFEPPAEGPVDFGFMPDDADHDSSTDTHEHETHVMTGPATIEFSQEEFAASEHAGTELADEHSEHDEQHDQHDDSPTVAFGDLGFDRHGDAAAGMEMHGEHPADEEHFVSEHHEADEHDADEHDAEHVDFNSPTGSMPALGVDMKAAKARRREPGILGRLIGIVVFGAIGIGLGYLALHFISPKTSKPIDDVVAGAWSSVSSLWSSKSAKEEPKPNTEIARNETQPKSGGSIAPPHTAPGTGAAPIATIPDVTPLTTEKPPEPRPPISTPPVTHDPPATTPPVTTPPVTTPPVTTPPVTTPPVTTPPVTTPPATTPPATTPPAATTGSKPETITTSDLPTVGVAQAEDLLTSAKAKVAAAPTPGILNGDIFRTICDLGNALALMSTSDAAEAARAKSARAGGAELLRSIATTPNRKPLGDYDDAWLFSGRRPADKPGVLLVGYVESIAPYPTDAGEVFETRLSFQGKTERKEVVVLTAARPEFQRHDNAGFLGTIVTEPSKHLKWYAGKEPLIVLSGVAVKLP